MLYRGQRVALIIPCRDEAASIGAVVRDFRTAMPAIEPYVFDNGSTDGTADAARASGALVTTVDERGKGNVVRRMFADVDADVYVTVDGDGTYDAGAVCTLVDALLERRLDMVVACRDADQAPLGTYRPWHRWGSRVLGLVVRLLFGGGFTDMFSGYRAFSRRFAKSFPARSHGFEVETEFTVHALELRIPWGEVTASYRARIRGSQSKFSTWLDGTRILRMILWSYVSYRPLAFFGACAAVLACGAAFAALPPWNTAGAEGRFELARTNPIASMLGASLLSLGCGLALAPWSRRRVEAARRAFLSVPPSARAFDRVSSGS